MIEKLISELINTTLDTLITITNTMETKLLYMEDMQALSCTAQITDLKDGQIILNQTVFYPQGGGQPYDTGEIISDGAVFDVKEVRFDNGQVVHHGDTKKGDFKIGDCVECKVNEERRTLHSRIHSAGHVIDMALKELSIPWIPGKGYHFPDGSYVEYAGNLDDDVEDLKKRLEDACNQITQSDVKTEVVITDSEKISDLCHHVPTYLPKGRPVRVVMYGDFGVPCGGTHVEKLSDIGKITVRKIKQKKGVIKVSYQIGN